MTAFWYQPIWKHVTKPVGVYLDLQSRPNKSQHYNISTDINSLHSHFNRNNNNWNTHNIKYSNRKCSAYMYNIITTVYKKIYNFIFKYTWLW